MQRQILDRQELQVAARAEYEKEREMVDAVMAAIDEEDRLQARSGTVHFICAWARVPLSIGLL